MGRSRRPTQSPRGLITRESVLSTAISRISAAPEYVGITDDEAMDAFQKLCHIEGIIPALESSHALAYALKLAPTLPKDKKILVNLSGRGDKDLGIVTKYLKAHEGEEK